MTLKNSVRISLVILGSAIFSVVPAQAQGIYLGLSVHNPLRGTKR